MDKVDGSCYQMEGTILYVNFVELIVLTVCLTFGR